MKNIVIVGIGKAAYLHYIKYKKLGYDNIYFLDNKITKTYIDSTNIFYDIEDLFEVVNFQNTVVDICTPCSVFLDIIDKFISKGIINFIVEKPFVVPDNYFDDKENIKFIMMENYCHSLITKDMIRLLNELKLNIKKIRIDFSKDRIKNSMFKRGISNSNITTNFEIEMPHEIYLADHLVSEGKKEYSNIYLEDMESNGVVLPKHGYGLIEYTRNGVEVILESNLMKGPNKRLVEVEFEGGVIRANYINYDVLFNIECKGNLEIIMGDYKRTIEYNFDDNMLYSLKEYLYNLENEINIKKYKEEILSFSDSLSYVIQNEGLIRSGKFERKTN